jgi:asparagine synthase (glutamine-hydrolysing)
MEAVARMTCALRSRGPDGGATWSHGWVALGHRRLKVIDLSGKADQPMTDAELGVTVTFNGCVYNYAELRARLAAAGYRFRTSGDTEVIIKAYHFWGDSFPEHLSGMFAIALVDIVRRRVVLVRDRLGIKPLYVSETSHRIRFASTIQALMQGGDVDTSIDLTALHHQLAWQATVPAPMTIVRGIRKHAPATVRVIDASGQSYERIYWRPLYSRDPDTRMGEREWAEAMRAALAQAVRQRLVGDVPLGVLLSGGLDSSMIVALAAASGHKPATFSIGFEPAGGQPGDEFEWSDLVSRQFGTVHYKIKVSGDRLAQALPAAVAAMSEPMISRDAVAFYLLAQEVSREFRVVLSGQGADEVFGGYFWHQRFAADSPGTAARRAARLLVNDEIISGLADEARCGRDASAEYIRAHMSAFGAATGLDAMLRLDTHVTMAEGPVKRVDNMAMAWGVEGRMPFTDHAVIELAARCPPGLKLASGGKGVLKAVAADLSLPPALITRPKGYFPVPSLVRLDAKVSDWLRAVLGSSASRNRGLFDRRFIARLLAAPPGPGRDRILWQAGLLEHWLQSIIPEARLPCPPVLADACREVPSSVSAGLCLPRLGALRTGATGAARCRAPDRAPGQWQPCRHSLRRHSARIGRARPPAAGAAGHRRARWSPAS